MFTLAINSKYLVMKMLILLKRIGVLLLLASISSHTVNAQVRKSENKKEIRKEAESLLEKQRQVEAERAALKALYYATGGEEWLLSDNWLSDKPITDWFGVRRD